MNLIQNAFKFTIQGSITIRVGYDYRTQNIRVNVKDTGIGVKQEDEHKLFV